MGTRCITIVKDRNDKEVLNVYRQMDGYPDGHGAELKEHFEGFTSVNGISISGNTDKIANGMGCLAAQIVAKLKVRVGSIYIQPAETRECGEEYVYEIDDRDGKIGLKVYDGPMTMFGYGGEDCTNLIYDGLLDDFDPGMESEAD